MKQIVKAAAAGIFLMSAAALSAQNDAADEIPFDTDLSAPAAENAAQTGAVRPAATVAQGIWIQAYGDGKFLTRDVAEGTKKGYEFDKADLVSKANWWFWGDITPSFHLDAEVGVWNFDNVMYQSNSYAANVPDVTWGDGLQSLLSRFYAPVYGMSDKTAGAFNKMGFTVKTPVVSARAGYGTLNDNTMSGFTGIYNMLNPWRDVGKGFLEIKNGDSLKTFGPVTVDALFALSRMRGEYGMYSVLNTDIASKADIVLTYGSTTNKSELFRYDEQNDNAVSAYVNVKPSDFLSVEAHAMSYYSASENIAADTSAAAARVTFTQKAYDIALSQSFAGSKAATVWGDDTTVGADASTTALKGTYRISDMFTAGLDARLELNDVSDMADGLIHIRAQPMFDTDFAPLFSKPVTVKTYGVIDTDRIAQSSDSAMPWTAYFDEAGIEVDVGDVATWLKKLTFDYAAKATYDTWTSGSSAYALDVLYHSIMIEASVNDSLGFTLGSILKNNPDPADTFIPYGFAGGVSYVTNWKAIGSPRVWMNAIWGMDPYEDVQYSLYRADSYKNGAIPHRTYLLNTVLDSANDCLAESHIRVGMTWDIK